MEKKTKMVGIVIVSHSNRLAEEVINFSKILQQDKFNIENTEQPWIMSKML